MNTRRLDTRLLLGLLGAINGACTNGLVADDGSGGRVTQIDTANGGATTTSSGGTATGGTSTTSSSTGGIKSSGGGTAIPTTGGAKSTGGTPTGGAPAAGAFGSSGSAGRPVTVANGGSATIGGNAATGGAVPTGGSVSVTGGSTSVGNGGTAGVPVTVATGGTTSTGTWTKCFDFATSSEGWKKSYAFVSLITDKTVQDMAASSALLSDTYADWMDAPGYGGTNGFVRLTIPFAENQVEYQSLVYSYLPATGLNLTGKTIHAFVKLVSGMTADDPSKPSGAKLVVKTGADWFYSDGSWVNMAKNEWIELTHTVSTPANMDTSKDASLYDPADVREISVGICTSGSATSIISPGIVYLDRICY